MKSYPTTPDGRYFVVRGRLWRCSNPKLSSEEKKHWTAVLMKARRAKGIAMRSDDDEARETARRHVDEAKIALGERGQPWWSDGAPDWNRHMAKNTPYAEWFSGPKLFASHATPADDLARSNQEFKEGVPTK